MLIVLRVLQDLSGRERGHPAQVHQETLYPELFGAFTGHLWADVLLYPLETIMHRLHVQVSTAYTWRPSCTAFTCRKAFLRE